MIPDARHRHAAQPAADLPVPVGCCLRPRPIPAPRSAARRARPRAALRSCADQLRRRVRGVRPDMTVSVHETWEGGNNLHRYANPHRATWEPITLEQGLALDDTLERGRAAVLEFLARKGAAAEPVKRNVFIDVWDAQASAATGRAAPQPRIALRVQRMGQPVPGAAPARRDGRRGRAAVASSSPTRAGGSSDDPTFEKPPTPRRHPDGTGGPHMARFEDSTIGATRSATSTSAS